MADTRDELNPRELERSMRTYGPAIGGGIVLLIGIVCLAEAVFVSSAIRNDSDPPFFVNSFVEFMFYVELAASPVIIAGGICGMIRRFYPVAVTGGLVGVFIGLTYLYILGGFVALIGLGIMTVAKAEFRSRPKKEEAIDELISGDGRRLQPTEEQISVEYDGEPYVSPAPDKQSWMLAHWKPVTIATLLVVAMLVVAGLINTQSWSGIRVNVMNADAEKEVYLAIYIDEVMVATGIIAPNETYDFGVFAVPWGVHSVGLDVNYTVPHAFDGKVDAGMRPWIGMFYTMNTSFYVHSSIVH